MCGYYPHPVITSMAEKCVFLDLHTVFYKKEGMVGRTVWMNLVGKES